ncbi:hypothetical protein EPYR_01808 [Erwinia pyrifoliae DSM 12163]|nr:hypothetical protein EJP617_30130 [Erwinia sp. Ejp617]CAY74188.1 hypothetical protein EPYR_01808 [Erwinia pyrifoliae DSM 12163]
MYDARIRGRQGSRQQRSVPKGMVCQRRGAIGFKRNRQSGTAPVILIEHF